MDIKIIPNANGSSYNFLEVWDKNGEEKIIGTFFKEEDLVELYEALGQHLFPKSHH